MPVLLENDNSLLTTEQYSMQDIIYINIGFTKEDEGEFEDIKNNLRKRRELRKAAKAEKRKLDGVPDDKVQ